MAYSAKILESAVMDGLPPIRIWKVLLLALFVPAGIVLIFLVVFGLADRPIPPEEFRNDPQMGQKISDRNSGLVFMHAAAQFAFMMLGAWYVKMRAGNRPLFLLIVIPIGVLVFLISRWG